MEIFFGEVDLEFYNNVDPSELFEHRGNYYWYRAVVDEEQACFYDTCDRRFPVGLEDCEKMIKVLTMAFTKHKNQQHLDQLSQKMEEELRVMAHRLGMTE